MILNISRKNWDSFSAMQRKAVRGEAMISQKIKTFEDFEKLYDSHTNVTKVIVDVDTDFVLANDILNYVSCKVVTLSVECLSDNGRVNFLNYE